MPEFGAMPMGCASPTRASSARRLPAVIFMEVVVWYHLLLEVYPAVRPLISSLCALIWRRPLPPLASLFCAAMGAGKQQVAGGELVPAEGSCAHPQRRLTGWSYGARWLPAFIAAPLPLQAEGRPSLSSLPECYMGGSCSTYLEFAAACFGSEGIGFPSGSSPVKTMLNLDRCCFGPDCSSCFQFRVLLAKIRDLGVISAFFRSLYELCAVLADIK